MSVGMLEEGRKKVEAAGLGDLLVLKEGEHELDPLGFNDRVSAIRITRVPSP